MGWRAVTPASRHGNPWHRPSMPRAVEDRLQRLRGEYRLAPGFQLRLVGRGQPLAQRLGQRAEAALQPLVRSAIQRLREQGAEGVAIASIEMRQESTVVKATAPPGLDREALYNEARREFEAEKALLHERVRGLEHHAATLQGLLEHAISRPIHLSAQGGHVDNNRHQTISNATLTGSVVNQGSVTAPITLTLGQLPPDTPPAVGTGVEAKIVADGDVAGLIARTERGNRVAEVGIGQPHVAMSSPGRRLICATPLQNS